MGINKHRKDRLFKNFEITKLPNYQIYNSNIDLEKLKIYFQIQKLYLFGI